MDAVTVRWLWAFVDAPGETFDADVAFWQGVTRTSLSPRRGPQGQFVTLLPEHGAAWVKAQRLDDGPPRVHLDLDVVEPLPVARDRAVALGARVLDELDDVVVCASPGGLVFCLTRWHPDETGAGQVREGAASLVDQVCLDIPSARYDAEVAFWRGLTGWTLRDDPTDEVDRGHLPLAGEFEHLDPPRGLPVQLLLQRLDDEDGPVRAHLDLCAVDPPAEVERHLGLGAEHVVRGRGWTVLRDPAGALYCVTDRHPDDARRT
ncbi:hypothetical protein GCM10028777_33220 [Angustibacter speluncae]